MPGATVSRINGMSSRSIVKQALLRKSDERQFGAGRRGGRPGDGGVRHSGLLFDSCLKLTFLAGSGSLAVMVFVD